MIIVSEGKVEAKIVKDAFAAWYMSGRVLLCTCVIQTEKKGEEKRQQTGERKRRNKGRKQRMLKRLKNARTLSDLACRFVTSNMPVRECRLVV